MSRRTERGPPLWKCGNPECGHLLDPTCLEASVITAVPLDRIHRIIDSADPEITFRCYRCGHFTEYLKVFRGTPQTTPLKHDP